MEAPPTITSHPPTFLWTRKAWWRVPLALALMLNLGWFSGPFIRSGGFGGWILWLFCMVVCPFAVCFVADRWYFFLAPLTSLLISCSLSYQNFLFYKRHSDDPWLHWKPDLNGSIGVAIFFTIVSFGIAYAINKSRKAS